ncbi:MAG: TolC family protein [Saprospiraceae bacterium]|nr:TolC family protein [Lewinellaceae bacterium]
MPQFNSTPIAMLLFATLLAGGMQAQPLLTADDAVKITLENNYNIKVAKNNTEIAMRNASRELNGYLPTINAGTGANASLGGSTQQFSNGNENVVTNAFNWGANASVTANYTLLDKSRDASAKRLQELVRLTDLQTQQVVETNVLQVIGHYYEVARLTQNMQVLEQTIALSEQRLLRARYRYEYGQGIRLDVLNAEVDIQRDSINFINSKNQLANAKRNLNVAMGRAVDIALEVDTLVGYDPTLSLDQLVSSALENNISIRLTNQNLNIFTQDLEVINASNKPTLGASAGYNFNFSDNASGSFVDLSNSRGFSTGINLNWNIYDGGRRKVQREINTINVANQRILNQQLQDQIRRDVANAWETYQNALFILRAEQKNLATNRLNFERTEEQFKIGQVSSVEFRQAQLNLLNAATSYNTAKYDAKVIELQLLQLAGRLF